MYVNGRKVMFNIEIFGDDEYFIFVFVDGVCVFIFMGLIVYNFVVGGLFCYFENFVMLVMFICVYILFFRLIILFDMIVFRIGVLFDVWMSFWVSFDGWERVELRLGDYVMISVSRFFFVCV